MHPTRLANRPDLESVYAQALGEIKDLRSIGVGSDPADKTKAVICIACADVDNAHPDFVIVDGEQIPVIVTFQSVIASARSW